MNKQDILCFYEKAKKQVIARGYEKGIKWAESLRLENCNPMRFFQEYVWCVLNAGMREQVARKIYNRFSEQFDLLQIGHEGKRKAIKEGLTQYKEWFIKLQELKTNEDKIDYLESLTWIGKITKFHLARNIGIDCVKPDRHLMRLASEFDFETPLDLCEAIQKVTNERLGVIDLVLWRYCNIKGNKLEKKSRIKQKELECI